MSSFFKSDMLKKIAHSPRTQRDFTDGDVASTTSSPHIWGYLVALVNDGLIFLGPDDHYHITPKGLEHLNRKPEMVLPRTWCAASTQGNYVPKAWTPARAGADEHKQHPSRSTWG
jgi:hypothetical protein